jgi:hypothetical protein
MQRVSFKFLEICMAHNELTIDFNDASFDEANSDVQPFSPSVTDIDVVFPISDDANFAVSRADNRPGSENSVAVGSGTASAIALMPDQATANVMNEFLFEFENDIDHDNNVNTPAVQGLKITTEGGSPGNEVINNINIVGSFEDLHNGGTLEVYADLGQRGNQAFTRDFNLGAPKNNPGNDDVIFVGGDDGADLGAGRDFAMINVDATARMTGTYEGGPNEDVLMLVEGVVSDNGARVDFFCNIKSETKKTLLTKFFCVRNLIKNYLN